MKYNAPLPLFGAQKIKYRYQGACVKDQNLHSHNQKRSSGDQQLLDCGIFIPYKGIDVVYQSKQNWFLFAFFKMNRRPHVFKR